MESQGIAGVSDHSLLSSRAAPIPVEEEEQQNTRRKETACVRNPSSRSSLERDVDGVNRAEYAYNSKDIQAQRYQVSLLCGNDKCATDGKRRIGYVVCSFTFCQTEWDSNMGAVYERFGVIMVGEGRAGSEAALESAHLGAKTPLLMLNIDGIAWQLLTAFQFGLESRAAGRFGESASHGLTENLQQLGFETDPLKTGTPTHVDCLTFDFSGLEPSMEIKRLYFSYALLNFSDLTLLNLKYTMVVSVAQQTKDDAWMLGQPIWCSSEGKAPICYDSLFGIWRCSESLNNLGARHSLLLSNICDSQEAALSRMCITHGLVAGL
ncbi:MnmG, N-terminal domain [Dillenia turbinata]|uniref:MnmG, N-terminal domain n=1 Tax=Dillenia turbinata TaxID=194707 RepID=A0AAN8USJ6_9MAGN